MPVERPGDETKKKYAILEGGEEGGESLEDLVILRNTREKEKEGSHEKKVKKKNIGQRKVREQIVTHTHKHTKEEKKPQTKHAGNGDCTKSKRVFTEEISKGRKRSHKRLVQKNLASKGPSIIMLR